MLLWVALLMSRCFSGLDGAAAGPAGLERIEECGTSCSQGLQCKTKPNNWFPPPCQNPGEGVNRSSVFHDVDLSTVMRCEGRQKCSLHLRIKTAINLTESIHGLSVCTVTAGMMPNCQIFSFRRESRHRLSGLKVEVENDCTVIPPRERVQVTVETVPSYCGVTWTGTYDAPACISEDLRRHVPECITGRLSYDVNPQTKELRVSVSDMLEDQDYHLRLCHRDFICAGTGAHRLIKKGERVMSAILPYSQPLPCLCIEGWSDVTDASRVQICPFKHRLGVLWSGINFDPLEETLSWEPICPVAATAVLCQKRADGVCVDLPHGSQNVSRKKITFTKVDPHPQLCMKFTAGRRSWTRCPFANPTFQAWEVVVSGQQGQKVVKVLSQVAATFSVGLCVKPEGSTSCQITDTYTVDVEQHNAVGLNLKGEPCNSCLQVKRLNVKFAATVTHCLEQCNQTGACGPDVSSRVSLDFGWIILHAAVLFSGIFIFTLALHVLLTVYQKRKQNVIGGCISEKRTDPASDCAVVVLKPQPPGHGGFLIPDSPQCGNTEKANLI
uniref:Interleukin-17 receptor C/E N-terminal domain-containing protein n=1 Tax=Gasterosteus aculeatus aculeatus TaxID=481459 RepID=G3Q5F9_GASAC|nr:putative interleukin-17 receptor E-like [Gasterosteus aculeatus aculeatus]